jgi:plastocyanin
MRFSFSIAVLAAFSLVSAKDIIITVGGNTTSDPGMVFDPQEVKAVLGDTVIFNFTNGNHTATQSTFAAPCIPAHDFNISLNGFDSSFRNAGNESAITILSVPILEQNANTTMWFFDYNTCAEGGVGVINANDSSLETLAGFERNAMRLNGTQSASSISASVTKTASGSTSSQTKSSDASRSIKLGGVAALPLIVVALAL